MTMLLAVETSAALCSLAIHVDGRWLEDTQKVERLHNRVVLGRLDALTRRAGLSPHGFEAVAFGAGPGSFTGIRIAAAVAQGVAYASGGVVVPVSSSLALAAAAGERDAPLRDRRVLTVTRSRRDAHYLAGYRLSGSVPGRWLDDRLHQGGEPPADLPPQVPGVGDRPPWWPEERPFLGNVDVTAASVGRLALELLAAGYGVPPAEAFPVYVGGDSPWQRATS